MDMRITDDELIRRIKEFEFSIKQREEDTIEEEVPEGWFILAYSSRHIDTHHEIWHFCSEEHLWAWIDQPKIHGELRTDSG